jgi:hypothetical protein
MIRSFKVLGTTLIAICAMTAVAASAASAAEFESEGTESIVEGQQATKNVFTVNSRTFECAQGVLNGSQAGLFAATLEVHPEYSECVGFGLPGTIITSGCKLKFNSPTGTTPGPFSGTANLVCTGGSVTNLSNVSCTITAGSQGPLPGVTYTDNAGPPMTVTVSFNIALSVNVSGSTLVCGPNGSRTLVMTGSMLTRGYNSSKTIQRGYTVM